MIARPREPKGTPRQRALIEIATLVTEEPWRVRRVPALDDEALLHTIALAAYFGHLNRIADAVAVPLDYEVRHMPPATDPTVPALAPAPAPLAGTPGLALARRAATAAAIEAWRTHVFDRDAPLSRDERAAIAGSVAGWLGDPRQPARPIEPDLHRLAELVTLAPWQLSDAVFAPLRARGWNDEKLFDAVVTASTAGLSSRVHVALVALG
ncbi:MAG: hypothetical protein ABI678_16335 [Kofleriaceae bacterium]